MLILTLIFNLSTLIFILMNIFDHINKKFVGVAFWSIVLIVGLSWYLFYGSSAEPSGAVTEISVSPLERTIGKDMLETLSKMKITALDESIFDDPVFRSLRDFGVEIASQPIGRRNPFGAFASAIKPASKPVKKPVTATGDSGTGNGRNSSSQTVSPGSFSPPSPEDIMHFDDFSF